MRQTIPILRARRERRLSRQRASATHARGAFLSAGMILSLAIAAFIIIVAFAYADLTSNLPSIELLPRLLNPSGGLLLQPTRLYDRTGAHVIITFAPNDSLRRYVPLNDRAPEHLPKALGDAVIATADPTFWENAGYTVSGLDNPSLHPTIAQRLVSGLLLYDEPPSFQRAVRERILAAEITAHFYRAQILEWYLNSANFGNNAYGADAAAQLYFNKPASALTTAECAILAAVSDSPSLNPFDAPQTAIQRGRELILAMQTLKLISADDAARALAEKPAIQLTPPAPLQVAPAFVNLVLAQLESRFPRERIERGGLTITTTLDYDLQQQASCITEVYAARLAGLPDPSAPCDAAQLLPSLPPETKLTDPSSSALVLDSKTGQVLAVVGETSQGKETPLLAAHTPGSALDAFIYLTGFTRGLGPGSLMWDIPGRAAIQNFDGKYHGPVRLRIALANDYPAPAAQVMAQMGSDNVAKIAGSFGLKMDEPVALLNLAGAYGVFGTQGVYFGQQANDAFLPVTVLHVDAVDHSSWLDWTTPQARPVVTPALAYLMTNALSDETARWPSLGRPNSLEIGRPAGVKLGQTADGLDSWTIGYTPARVVAVWTGARSGSTVTPQLPAVLWSALTQYAVRGLAPDGWSAPAGVTAMNVCDPSGMLPTTDCPNVVSEVFLNGDEPVQADNLYRKVSINRETGLLSTVFTPPQLVEDRVYLMVPGDARAWAQAANIPVPPDSYDAIQAPPRNPDVNISAPAMFADVNGKVQVSGTASGKDFAYYRVLVGKGLNPQEWIQVGADVSTSVVNGVLAEWDTTGLSGLYAVQVQVVSSNQQVETAVIQVTVK